MSQDYETKRPDLRASRDEPGGGQSAAEDPLVELARIVHKNKQSGADVSSGRVGSTDYFAGLDDVAAEPAVTDTQPVRREPTFDPAPTELQGQGTTPPRAETDAGAPVSAASPEDELEGELGRAFQSNRSAPAAGSSHVSALWPEMPKQEDGANPAAHQPTAFTPEDPAPREAEPQVEPRSDRYSAFEPIAANDATSQAPALAVDLEQSLSSELEDELIGALRQSVDETQPAVTAPVNEARQDPVAPEPQSYDNAGYGAAPGFSAGYQVEISPTPPEPPQFETGASVADTSTHEVPGPSISTREAREPISSFEKTAPAEPVVRSEPRLGTPVIAPDPETVQRPRIDEDDLFAALNPDSTAAPTRQSYSDPGQPGEPAGIDALFADLEFPPPGERKTAAQEPPRQSVVPEDGKDAVDDIYAGAAEIDDMTWPAAAAAVPQSEEDETPPPPEGYDLDAVARAMQESDPSLTGAGVLPPHSPAEREAVPQAREKSRRGLVVAAGILGVAVLGGAGFFLFDGDSVVVPSGPPPVISGLQEPLKIYPDDTQAPVDDQSAKLIYDRVGGNAPAGPERLVLPETPQPAELPPAPAGTNGSADLVPGAPKRVRTVIVRPDGTFVSDNDQAAPAVNTPAAPAPAAPSTEPAAPATGTDTSRVVATTPIAPETGNSQPAPATDSSAQDVPAIVSGTGQPETEPQTSEPAAPVPSVLPRKKPAAPVQVASAPPAAATPAPATQNDGPLNLTQPAAAPAAPAASGTTGSIAPGTYIVQVTSQRSAAAASEAYSGLQRRFPSVLGNRNAVIVSANVEDRGVFYRARIPTTSRDEAISLCESLQAAGGDCFVRRQP